MSETDHKNNTHNTKSLLEEYEDLLEGEREISPESKEMLESFETDEEFNKEIEALVLALTEGDLDLSQIQTKFLLLIKAKLSKLTKSELHSLEQKFKHNEQSITDQLATLSNYLMMQKASIVRMAKDGIDSPKDKYEHANSSFIKNTQQLLKRFAVYEIYKVMNPHRIAGETKRQNFVNNYITGGLKNAMHYDPKELKHTSAQEIKQLEKAHNSFRKSGGIVR